KRPRSRERLDLRCARLRRFLRQWHRARPTRKRATTQRYPASQQDLWLELSRAFDATAGCQLFPEIPRTSAISAYSSRLERRRMYWPAQILTQDNAARTCNAFQSPLLFGCRAG